MLLRAFLSARSARMPMERIDCDPRFRWLAGLERDAGVRPATVFTHNRDRLPEADAARVFLSGLLELRQVKRLLSSGRFGETTALAMRVEMPEFGTLGAKRAASLAGLAPISRQSGKWRGKERIRSGRPVLRRTVHMPALVATRFNPAMKATYERLRKAGKPALAAVMRKLVVMADALIRDDREWDKIAP